MAHTARTFIAVAVAVAALAMPLGAYAQNNTLATPSTVSPAAVKAPAKPVEASGAVNAKAPQPDNANHGSTPLANPPGSHNTLATPSVVSPAAAQ